MLTIVNLSKQFSILRNQHIEMTAAIARGAEKEADARSLGAHHYIDAISTDVAAALQELGGAAVVLATAANSRAMADTVGGIALHGELVNIGVSSDPLPKNGHWLMLRRRTKS